MENMSKIKREKIELMDSSGTGLAIIATFFLLIFLSGFLLFSLQERVRENSQPSVTKPQQETTITDILNAY